MDVLAVLFAAPSREVGMLPVFATSAFLLYMMVRNCLVLRFRLKVIDWAHDLSTLDMASPEDLELVIDELERRLAVWLAMPSYYEMLLRFWVWPLSRFIEENDGPVQL